MRSALLLAAETLAPRRPQGGGYRSTRHEIRFAAEALTFVERLKMLLHGVASSFVITDIVGLSRRGVALRQERLAQEHAAACGRSGDQRITVAQFVADERPASRSDGVADNAGGANARAARQYCANEN